MNTYIVTIQSENHFTKTLSLRAKDEKSAKAKMLEKIGGKITRILRANPSMDPCDFCKKFISCNDCPYL